MSHRANTGAPLTVRAVVALYLRHSAATGLHCPEALAERHRTLSWFCDHCGDLPVEDCRPYHLSDWIEAHPGWKSVATRRAKANVVRACFEWAAQGERIARNPFKSVKYAEANRRPDMPDDVTERVCRLANKPFERAVRFLRLTGARLSELCAATWADVDLDLGLWTIPKHKSVRFTHKPKLVALVPEAVQLLRDLEVAAGAGAPGAEAVQAPDARGAPIFLNNRGTPWNRRTLGQQLRRMKRRLGISERATLHGLRHAMATAALGNGAPILLVAEQLGHASPVITTRYYWHRSAQHLEAVRDAAARGRPS